MRILALDYGRKRIGLALSDPLGITAQPIGMIPRKGKPIEALLKLIEENEVSEIVFGYPRSMKGEPSEMAQEVERFAEVLRAKTDRPIHFWDERLSSSESEHILLQGNVRRKKRKEVRDSLAASLILQGFLANRTVR